MPYPRFDRSQLRLQPLSARRHDLAHSHLLDLVAVPPPPQAAEAAAWDALAQRLIAARHAGAAQHEADRGDPQYYYRPWKTILVHTVADGGRSYYIRGDHRHTLPQLRHCLLRAAETA